MNGQIFISYRRQDASYPAGRLYDNLHNRFPQNEIFMDVDSLKPGSTSSKPSKSGWAPATRKADAD